MSECPEIVVYELYSTSRFIPAIPNCIARFHRNGDFLPMIFSGDTAEAAIATAHAFWASETAKIEARRSNMIKAREGRQRQQQSI
jgi:hypothetical protein